MKESRVVFRDKITHRDAVRGGEPKGEGENQRGGVDRPEKQFLKTLKLIREDYMYLRKYGGEGAQSIADLLWNIRRRFWYWGLKSGREKAA